MTLTRMEGVKDTGERVIKRGVREVGLRCSHRKVTDVIRNGCDAPVGVEAFTKMGGMTFFDVMNAVVIFGIKDDFACIADVTFAKKRTFGTLGSFDGGGETTRIGGEPRDHLRRL